MSETITLGFTNPDYVFIDEVKRLGGTGVVIGALYMGLDIDVVI